MGQDNTVDHTEAPRLIVHLPDGTKVYHPIVGQEISIGRNPSNHISIPHHMVSNFHAKLRVSGQRFTLVALRSANKTLVNGRELSTNVAVRYGDELRFAGVKCYLEPPKSKEQKTDAPASSSAEPEDTPNASPPALKATIKPATHPLTTNPKTRFILVGGVLVGIGLAVAILLWLLLVPYDEAGVNQAEPNLIPPAATAVESLSPATRLPEPPSPEAPVPFESPTAPSSVGPQQPVEFYLSEARAYLDMGRLIEARTNLRKVLEIDPQNNQAQERLNLLEEEIGDKAEQHFNQAREAFDSELYQEAMAQWEIFLSLIEPSDERYAEAWQGIEKARAELQ